MLSLSSNHQRSEVDSAVCAVTASDIGAVSDVPNDRRVEEGEGVDNNTETGHGGDRRSPCYPGGSEEVYGGELGKASKADSS